MQTILGANGQIAVELTKELHRKYTQDIRLVSRNPQKIHESDELFPANLLDKAATCKAVEGSSIAYLTAGLPIDSQVWAEQFPVIMRNVIDACKQHQVKLVFFDNTYMYAKTSKPQTEDSPFAPQGRKSQVRALMAKMLLREMDNQTIEAVICRAPEFYGPGKTQGITHALVFENLHQNRKAVIPLRDDTMRTLIWTPDASKATALIAQTPGAYQQTWHLPCDDNRPTYRHMIEMISRIYQKDVPYRIAKRWQFVLGSWFNPKIKELIELLPRYACDNIFLSQKFKSHFPDFPVTSFEEGITQIKEEQLP